MIAGCMGTCDGLILSRRKDVWGAPNGEINEITRLTYAYDKPTFTDTKPAVN